MLTQTMPGVRISHTVHWPLGVPASQETLNKLNPSERNLVSAKNEIFPEP